MLKGILTKQQSQGPFPAVVILSGGRGFLEAHQKMLKHICWGFLLLRVTEL
jgi:hypothetical protein